MGRALVRGAGVGQLGNTQYLGRLGYGVGIVSFLDSAESRIQAYFREIEEGTSRFVGREIAGLFGNEFGPRGELITGDLVPFGEGSGQKFVPFARPLENITLGVDRALSYLRATASSSLRRKENGNTSAAVSGIIKKPIVAQEAYRDAFASFDAAKKEKRAVLQVLGRSGAFSEQTNGFTPTLSRRRNRQQALSRSQVISRGGFLTAGATSGFNQSLVGLDGGAFAKDLIEINRLLAQGLAAEVAKIQEEKLLRPNVSSGRLIAATLNPLNRFPR